MSRNRALGLGLVVSVVALGMVAGRSADAAPAASAAAKDQPVSAAPAEGSAAAAQSAPSPELMLPTEADALALSEAFMQKIIADKYEEAFHLIRPYFPVPEARVANIEKETKQQLGKAELQFGAPLGHTFVGADEVQGTVLRYRFLQQYDLDVLFWEFIFYKPKDGWVINAIGFDDQIRDLFKK